MARISIMSALALVIRLSFAHLPNLQPVMAFFLVLSIATSFYEVILVMSLCILISSFLLGFGPWVFWQITTFSLILLIWHYALFPLTKRISHNAHIFQMLCAGLLAFLYGFVIDSFFSFIYSMPWWTYVLAGTPFNLAHALSTILFYPIFLLLFRRFFT